MSIIKNRSIANVFLMTGFAVLIFSALLGLGCGTPTTYKLILNPLPGEGGSIVVSPQPNDEGEYEKGESVTLEARPADGYRFIRWSGDITGSMQRVPVKMNSYKNVYAEFELIPIEYNLTINVSPQGKGKISPTEGGVYSCGEAITLSAVPEQGYKLDHWTGTDNNSANPTIVTMGSDRKVTAYFIPEQCRLSFSVAGGQGGSVSPSTGDYDCGETVTLTATPAPGYKFDHWAGVSTISDNPANITLDSDKEVTAYFVRKQCTLSVTVANNRGGTVSPEGGDYDCGETVDLSATPYEGYEFDHWNGTNDMFANPTKVTVTGNVTVTAEFKEEECVPDVQITSPVDGQEVYCEIKANGTFSSCVHDAIWPIVYIGGRYHPQDEGGKSPNMSNGKWSGTVRFGDCSQLLNDTGKSFMLSVVTADSQANAAFANYISQCKSTGNWPGLLQLPDGTEEYESITVVRK